MKLLLIPAALAAVVAHAEPLQWDTCAWGQTESGNACTGTPAALTWQQALQAAQQANGAGHQGHSDWRVPNRTELESTVDLAAPQAGAYWSSTSYHPAPAQAWGVDFADGSSSPAAKTSAQALRLVRGGDDYRAPGPATTPPLPLPSNPGETAQAAVTGGGSTCGFASAGFISAATLPAPPAHVTLAADPFDFVLDGCTPGSTVQITITYPQPLPSGAQFWKHGPRPGQAAGWYAYPHAAVSGNTVVLTLTDGALGDDDLDATNGRIVDAGAPAVMAMAAGGVAAIPTLSQWGMLLLSALLGLVALRRRA
ncbi:MAG: DUF1566 domain-containing protein [Ottowia sp.]|uniref:Lcl C-terminal domain-containing protein n=1 Tax=Ottowia sp. TaxID=1898956 RepID=UPI0039E6A1A2